MPRKSKQSLGNWMIENLGDDSIEKYWSNENTVNPFEIGKGTGKIKIWINCQHVYYHKSYPISPNKFTAGRRCPYCRGNKVHPKDSFAQWCIDNIDENFIGKYWSARNNADPFKISKRTHKEIHIKCQNTDYHDDYKTTPGLFIGQNQRCPFCANRHGKVHEFDSLGTLHPKSFLLWSNKNISSPFQYTPNSRVMAFWKCENKVHEDYERKISVSKKSDFRCPKCSNERKESILQEKVRLFLTGYLKYKVNHEHDCEIKCINPKTNIELPYDNEVIINNRRLIIEIHGEQHYKSSGYNTLQAKRKGTTPEKELEYMQWKDQYKMDYAISQGYFYLMLPYWTDNDSDEWKTLILNKIKEINIYSYCVLLVNIKINLLLRDK